MKLVKNYLYNVTYQIFILFIPLVTIPYISRVIGPNGVGVNAYTNSIIQYFVLFGSVGISLYGNRTIAYHRENKQELSKIFWEIALLRFITIALAYTMFLIFLLLTNKYHNYFLVQSVLIIAAGLDISWFYMGLEDFRKTVLRNTLVKIISVFLIFSFVKTKNDLAVYIFIISFSQLLGNVTLWPYLKRTLQPVKIKELNIFKHLYPSLALFIPQVAIQVYLVLNKTMLGSLSSITEAGFFDNSDKMIKIVLAVVTASGTVMLPRVANTFAKGNLKKVNEYLYQSFDFSSLIAIPLMFGLAGIAPNFSIWFFGKAFASTGLLITILSPVIVLIAWSNVTGQQYLMPVNKIKDYTISVTIGAVVNLIVNFMLIPHYGASGAAVATVLAEFVVTFYQIKSIKKYVDIKRLFINCWKYLISGSVMYGAVLYMNLNLKFNIFTLLLQVITGIIIYFGLVVLTKPSGLKNVREILNK